MSNTPNNHLSFRARDRVVREWVVRIYFQMYVHISDSSLYFGKGGGRERGVWFWIFRFRFWISIFWVFVGARVLKMKRTEDGWFIWEGLVKGGGRDTDGMDSWEVELLSSRVSVCVYVCVTSPPSSLEMIGA